jgi:hypothetical protein
MSTELQWYLRERDVLSIKTCCGFARRTIPATKNVTGLQVRIDLIQKKESEEAQWQVEEMEP